MDRRRLLLYAIALPLAGALGAGAIWRPPADCDTLATCAQFELRCGLLESAEAKAAAVLAREPRHFLGLMVDGACAELRGEKARACDRYAVALEVVPDPAQRTAILLGLAYLETELGRREASAAHLREAEADPAQRARAGLVASFWEERFGSRERALEHLRAALPASGEDAELAAAYGMRFAELGRREEGLGLLERAGEGPAVLYAVARLKFEGGEAENGNAVLTRLQASNRSWLRRRMERDHDFWDPIHERGDLPDGFLREGEAGRGPR